MELLRNCSLNFDEIVHYLTTLGVDKFLNKKASLGNSLVWIGFNCVGAKGLEPATYCFQSTYLIIKSTSSIGYD